MKSTREKILRTLLSFPGSTIKDLAEEVGINGISIRHHLASLEADGLVTSTEERHGVGRPRLIYTLTEKGVEAFPTSYLRLTRRVLHALKDRLDDGEIREIFEQIGLEIAANITEEVAGKSLEERLRLLKTLLTKEGFIVEWKKNEDAYWLTSFTCPYYRIGLEHPEICALDHALISAVLSEDVTVTTCLLNGEDRCTYQIPLATKEA